MGPYVIHLEPDLARSQYAYIHEQFKHALSQYNYGGSYLFAYPVKVNAKQHVFQSLSTQRISQNAVFEVGSRRELLLLPYAPPAKTPCHACCMWHQEIETISP